MAEIKLQTLKTYVNEVKTWFTSSMYQLQWSDEDLKQEKVICEENTSHLVHKESVHEHAKACRLRKCGLSAEETKHVEEEANLQYFYKNSTKVKAIHIDDDTFLSLLSATIEGQKSLEQYSLPILRRHPEVAGSAARAQLYELGITQAKGQGPNDVSENDLLLLPSQQKETDPSKPKSRLQQLAEQRDLKRRRQTYRGKNYTAKKSHTQIVKELIDSQMELLTEVYSAEKPSSSRMTSSKEFASEKSSENSADSRSMSRKRKSVSPSRSPHKHKKRKKSRERRDAKDKSQS